MSIKIRVIFYMTRITKKILCPLYILNAIVFIYNIILILTRPKPDRITMKSYSYLSPDHKDGMIHFLYSENFIAIQIVKKNRVP
jgi:hypothetical protein